MKFMSSNDLIVRDAYLVVPAVYATSGMISTPSSMIVVISSVARICAAAVKNAISARLIPGQTLMHQCALTSH